MLLLSSLTTLGSNVTTSETSLTTSSSNVTTSETEEDNYLLLCAQITSS